MNIRSWLFVPGDSERKLAGAFNTGADALVLDLEDSVAPSRKVEARNLVRACLIHREMPRRPPCWVRINALSTPTACLDLKIIVPAAPDGIMIPKVDDPSEMRELSQRLDELEGQAGLPPGHIMIIPILESPRGVLTAAGYIQTGLARLAGITWGREDLLASVRSRAATSYAEDSDSVSRMTRTQCLLAAKAVEVDAIETVMTDFRNKDALRACCSNARAEGFSGMLAVHPDQIAVINDTFQSTEQDITWARRVVAAFGSCANTGAVAIEGRMIDIAHLNAARKLLSTLEQ
jgi:citrate lyase subunit beta/citryl-CoA lyase